MLFIESRTAEMDVAGSLRIAVLDALQDRGLSPLIRASRLHCFEQALTGSERVGELERLVSDWSDKEGDAPYVRGDVFCFDDFAHFLIFGEAGDGVAGIRAGIVYGAETDEPARKLEAFCRNVREAVESAASSSDDAGLRDDRAPARFEWHAREGGGGGGVAQFSSAAGDGTQAPPPGPPRGAEAAERLRVVELLEEMAARNFLQRLSDARADGRVAEMPASGGGHEPVREALIARLAGAGLVRREVQVSCRKDGRSLFRLPSPEALQMVTASNAVCSECGAAVADERAEELLTPTALAASMLKDGAWLLSSLRTVLVELGLPERGIAARASSGEGAAQMLADVCGEPFLFVLRDGDFNTADVRRALESEAETHSAHLVVVATGKIQDEARARLREHARRRSRTGGGMEVVFIEGVETAPAELRQALERVSQAALTRELYELDASAGFNVGYMLAERFRLVHRTGALQDLAASAAGSLAGSLREI
ncbi:MAG: hypothetical protein LC802_07160 [Acidobacteria bacterium]|nr:hypothetical protein [Acidobacteriota bacterium]